MRKIVYVFLCIQCLAASEINFQKDLLENQKLQAEEKNESKEESSSKSEEKSSNIQQHSDELGDWTGHFFTKVGLIVHKPTFIMIGSESITGDFYYNENFPLYGYIVRKELHLKLKSTSKEFIEALKIAEIYND